MISITQEPYGLQPVNSEHIWTIYDDEYTGYTNYKYVIDLYIDPFEEGHEKIGRVKLRPNSSGRGSFNARDIINNYLTPNPRTSGNFPIINESGFTFTNQLNDVPINNEVLRHIANYKIIIGKEYTSGGTQTIDIETDYYTPSYELSWSVPPGTDNIIISNANGWEDLVSSWALTNQTWDSGFTWTHETSGGSFVDGGSSFNDGFTYTPSSTPSSGDVFWVYSNQNNCGVYFIYAQESISWDFQGSYSREYEEEGCYETHSDFKTIWVGAAPNLLMDSDTTSQSINSEWAQRFHFYRDTIPPLDPYEYGYENKGWDITEGSFLNQFGTKFIPLNWNDMDFTSITQTEPYYFQRNHHRDCPIIVSWFNGQNGAFKNGSYDFLIEFTGSSNTITPVNQLTPLSDGDDTFTPANELIQMYIENDISPNYDWLGYMISDGTPGADVFEDGQSMILLYKLYGSECMDDPIHFMFVNRNGALDTYTFGRKNTRSHSTSISTYAQDGIRDAAFQQWSSYMYRNTPYDQTTTTSVETQSNFVDENDVPIIQDLFLSPYVWRIQKFKDSFYLVPIQITSTSVEEYKNKYNKLYQYDMTFTYNPIRQFNNPL